MSENENIRRILYHGLSRQTGTFDSLGLQMGLSRGQIIRIFQNPCRAPSRELCKLAQILGPSCFEELKISLWKLNKDLD